MILRTKSQSDPWVASSGPDLARVLHSIEIPLLLAYFSYLYFSLGYFFDLLGFGRCTCVSRTLGNFYNLPFGVRIMPTNRCRSVCENRLSVQLHMSNPPRSLHHQFSGLQLYCAGSRGAQGQINLNTWDIKVQSPCPRDGYEAASANIRGKLQYF